MVHIFMITSLTTTIYVEVINRANIQCIKNYFFIEWGSQAAVVHLLQQI